eukprot:Nitzschia sp. Nitz4//scaffold13_size275219//9408//10919//NITZ4_000834-RA/size275219-processed-gene-0.121-mRNA-1//-1//CDS//3329535894//8750//frame0
MMPGWRRDFFCPPSSSSTVNDISDTASVFLDNRLNDLRKDIDTLKQRVLEWKSKYPLEQCRFLHRKEGLITNRVFPATSTTSSSLPPSVPEAKDVFRDIPIDILVDSVAPFISDRSTYNAFAMMNREIYGACFSRPQQEQREQEELCQHPNDSSTLSSPNSHLLPPWPTARVSIGARLWSLAFSPNQQLLAVGGTGGRIILIDRFYGPVQRLNGHLGLIYAIDFTWDGNTMVSLSGDGEICVWDMNPPRLEKESDSRDGCGLIFDSSHAHLMNFGQKPPEAVLRHQISTNATHSLSLALDPTLPQWVTGEGAYVRWYSFPPPRGKDVWTLDHGQQCMIESAIFSPDGKLIAAGNNFHDIMVWNVSMREMNIKLTAPACVHSIDFSPDGNFLVAGTDSNRLHAWRVRDDDGRLCCDTRAWAIMEGHTDLIWSVAWEGECIVSASDDGTVRVWSGQTFECLRILPRRQGSLYGVGLDTNSDTVASVGADGFVEIWNLRSSKFGIV